MFIYIHIYIYAQKYVYVYILSCIYMCLYMRLYISLRIRSPDKARTCGLCSQMLNRPPIRYNQSLDRTGPDQQTDWTLIVLNRPAGGLWSVSHSETAQRTVLPVSEPGYSPERRPVWSAGLDQDLTSLGLIRCFRSCDHHPQSVFFRTLQHCLIFFIFSLLNLNVSVNEYLSSMRMLGKDL